VHRRNGDDVELLGFWLKNNEIRGWSGPIYREKRHRGACDRLAKSTPVSLDSDQFG
jgi:hypothetical protein